MKKYLIVIVDIIIKILLEIINFFIRKSPNIVILGDFNGKRFGDNSKYLYLYLNKNKNKYGLEKVIWMTKDENIKKELENKNYEVYYTNSFQGIYYHIKALYHIIDQGEHDINPFFSHKAIRINLWHGYPLKKIMLFYGKINRYYVGGWKEQYLLVGTEFGNRVLGEAFGIKKEKKIFGLYPRVNFLLSDEYPIFNKEYEVLKKIRKIKEKKKILLYLPTFRDDGEVKFLGINNEKEEKDFFKFLLKNNYLLISKFHPAEKNKINIKESEEVYLSLDSNIDIYPILKEVDILITDYSSIYFDFLVLNKEIIFNPYDLEKYKVKTRGLLFDYDKITPGYKALSTEDVMKYLIQDKKIRDKYQNQRKDLCKLCFEERTIEEIIENILKIQKE